MSDLKDGVLATIASLEASFTRMDWGAVRALWDANETMPTYVAEEAERMIGWEAIDAYWKATERVLSQVVMRTWDHLVQPAGDGLAIAYYRMRWAGTLRTDEGLATPPPIAGEVQVSAVLREKTDGWRFVHYTEIPLAPMLHLIDIYARAAARQAEPSW